MQFDEKYQWVNQQAAAQPLPTGRLTSSNAIQQRLDRHVVVHRIPKQELDKPTLQDLRKTCSKLSRLDHTAIPHFIDFVDTGDEYRLIIESQPGERSSPSDDGPTSGSQQTTLLDEMAQFEQFTAALCHASDQGVFHGAIGREVLAHDDLQTPRLIHLGLSQLSPNDKRSDEQIGQDDAIKMGLLAEQIINRHVPPAPANAISQIDSDLSRQASELCKIIGQVRASKQPTIAQFHQQLSHWVAREKQTRAANKLAVHDDDYESTAATPWFANRALLISLAAGTSLVVLILLALLNWQPNIAVQSETQVANQNDKQGTNKRQDDGPANRREARTIDDFGPSGSPTEDAEPNDPETASKAVQVPLAKKTAEEADENDSIARSDAESKKDKDKAQNEAKDEDKETDSIDGENKGKKKPKTPTRKDSPFKNSVTKISLPEPESTNEFTLVFTTLNENEPLNLELAGGNGAYKQGEYRLDKGSSLTWSVSYEGKNGVLNLADIQRKEDALAFSWTATSETTTNPTLAKSLNAVKAHLANVVLVLKSNDWQHATALREYKVLDSIPPSWARPKPIEMRIKSLPRLEDIRVEFPQDEKVLAEVFGKRVIKIGERFQIGLEAGKKSLFAVGLEPRFKSSKQSIVLRGYGRPTLKKKFASLPRNYGATLRGNYTRATRSVALSMKAKEVAGKDKKKGVQKQIDFLQKEKSSLEKLLETYEAAIRVPIRIKVFRKVGAYRVPIVRFGEPE